MPNSANDRAIAVLVSGGLDSAILVGESINEYESVHSLYVRCGLYWESVELSYLERYLDAIRCPALKPLQILESPITDVYPDHWSIRGRDVPNASTPDEA